MILGVSLVLIENGKILLTKRNDFRLWCLPGGIVDDGETLEEAAVREAWEETGAEVTLERLVGIYSAPKFMRGGSHTAVFTARRSGGDLDKDSEEVVDLRNFAPEELPEDMLWWQRQQIEDALGGVAGITRRQDVTGPDREELDFEALRDSLEQGEIRLETVQAMLVKSPLTDGS